MKLDRHTAAALAALLLCWLTVVGFDISAIMRHFDASRPECCIVWPFVVAFTFGAMVLPGYGYLLVRPAPQMLTARVVTEADGRLRW